MNTQTNNTSNYLVPSSGSTHAVTYSGDFSATPQTIDWQSFSINNFPFQPQGAFIDNSSGVDDLVIKILPINYSVTCPAGATNQVQFPAPNNMSMEITGNGTATIVFVDFPVLPNAGVVKIDGTVTVQGPAAGVNTQPAQTATGGVPYLTQETPVAGASYQSSISGAALTATIIPVASTNLKMLQLGLSGDASLAVAGEETISVSLNGTVIYSDVLSLPAAAGTNPSAWNQVLDFSHIGLNAGAAGDLVVTIGTALATGKLSINAYFG